MARQSARARLSKLADRARSSLFVVPLVLMLAAAALAIVSVALDRAFGDDVTRAWWGFHAGPDGTRATLSAIAGSVMTVAGVAFSMTVVVLQLASSQFSPRVIRNFRRDRTIQVVFGVYLGTFTFAVIVLRTITSIEDATFSAPISVTVAMALGVVSLVLLAGLVHHVVRTAQVSEIIRSVARETIATMDRLHPVELGAPAERTRHRGSADPPPPRGDGEPWLVRAPRDGYIEYVDGGEIDALRAARLVRLEVQVGDYVRQGDVLASIWPACAADLEENDGAASVFSITTERTMRQDVRFGLQLVVDVALRALSPGINDPTTAVHCIDVAGALLCRLAAREVPDPLRRTSSGILVYAPRPTLGELVHLGLSEIARASREPRVLLAIARALAAIADRDADGIAWPAITATATQLGRVAERAAEWSDSERACMRDALRRVLAISESGPRTSSVPEGARAEAPS